MASCIKAALLVAIRERQMGGDSPPTNSNKQLIKRNGGKEEEENKRKEKPKEKEMGEVVCESQKEREGGMGGGDAKRK